MKYNWGKLKQDYLKSDILSVSQFMLKETGKKPESNSWIAEKVKGWKEEKKELAERAIEKTKEKVIKDIEMSKSELKKVKWAGYRRLAEKLLDKGIAVADVKIIINQVKTELGEPTTIAKGQQEVEHKIIKEQDLDEIYSKYKDVVSTD